MVICKRVGRVKSSSKEEMIKHARRSNREKPSLRLKGQGMGSYSQNRTYCSREDDPAGAVGSDRQMELLPTSDHGERMSEE